MDKTIIFIVAGESLNECESFRVKRALRRLLSLRPPTTKQVKAVSSILSKKEGLSQLGRRQVLDIRMIMHDERVWGRYSPALVLHSPQDDATSTCIGVLPVDIAEATASGRSCEVKPFPDLAEQGSHESPVLFRERIARLKRFLLDSNAETICIIGHPNYFKRLSSSSSSSLATEVVRNCDIWLGSIDGGEFVSWYVLYRTVLSEGNPGGEDSEDDDDSNQATSINTTRVRSSASSSAGSSGDANSDGDGAENENEHENEPCCRICHLTTSEAPSLKLIRPCRCTGSQSFVHIECLNRWRATSARANFTCSVCKYNYRVKKAWFADLLMSEDGAIAVTVILMASLVLLLGIGSVQALNKVKVDVPVLVFRQIEVHPWWRYCNLGYDFPQLVDEVFKQAQGNDLNIIEQVQLLWRFLRSPQLFFAILCSSELSYAVDVLLMGCSTVGAMGFLHFLWEEISSARRQHGGGNQGLQRIGMLGVWLVSLGNRALFRLGLFVGCCIAAREVYKIILVRGRQLAHTIGEQILEYSTSA